MNKFILLFLLVSLSLNSYSQQKDKEERKTELELKKSKKRKKSKCKIFRDKVNEFDGIRELHTQSLFIGKGEGVIAGTVSLKLMVFSQEGNEKYILEFKNTGYGDECKTESSFVNIKFKDGTFMKLLPWSNNIDCGVNYIHTKISKEQLDKFLDSPIDMIRSSIEMNRDYNIKEKSFLKFKKEVNCILSELE